MASLIVKLNINCMFKQYCAKFELLNYTVYTINLNSVGVSIWMSQLSTFSLCYRPPSPTHSCYTVQTLVTFYSFSHLITLPLAHSDNCRRVKERLRLLWVSNRGKWYTDISTDTALSHCFPTMCYLMTL